MGDRPAGYGGNQHPCPYCKIPDFLNSLDACHDMEEFLLTKDQQDDYHALLWPSGSRVFLAIRATASQRAECFLRCLNLWEPAPHD